MLHPFLAKYRLRLKSREKKNIDGKKRRILNLIIGKRSESQISRRNVECLAFDVDFSCGNDKSLRRARRSCAVRDICTLTEVIAKGCVIRATQIVPTVFIA